MALHQCIMNDKLNRYSQARMHVNISLRDMAVLLETDPSNLSKYEKAKHKLVPSIPMVIAYHIVTGVPFDKLLDRYVPEIHEGIVARLKTVLEELEREPGSTRVRKRMNVFGAVLANLCQDNREGGE